MAHRQLPDGQLVIFCGAGVSLAPPSNAPLWRPMREFIVEAGIQRVVKDGAGWDEPYPNRIRDFVKHPTLARIAPEVLFQILQSALGSATFASILACVGLGTPN